MPNIDLPIDPQYSSVRFSTANGRLVREVYAAPVFQYWADAMPIGGSASMFFVARLHRGDLGGNAFLSHSATVMGTQSHTATTEGFCVKYYGPDAPEVAYRNRYCFFARDPAGDYLGNMAPDGNLLTGTVRAIRSAPILDDAPRLISLTLEKTGAATTVCTVRTHTVDPGATEVGDIVSGSYDGTVTGWNRLNIGAHYGATWPYNTSTPTTQGCYWPGEISNVCFLPTAKTPLFYTQVMQGKQFDALSGFSPSLYRRMAGVADLSSASPADTYPDSFWLADVPQPPEGSTLTGMAYDNNTFFISLDHITDGRVVTPNGSNQIVISGRRSTSFTTCQLTVNLTNVTTGNSISKTMAVTQTGSLGDIHQWSMTFSRGSNPTLSQVPDGWYNVSASITGPGFSAPFSAASRNRLGVGERVWVFGDTVTRKICDGATTFPFAANSTSSFVPVTSCKRLGPGQYGLARTTTNPAADVNGFMLTDFIDQLGRLPSSGVVEVVMAATVDDTIANWLADSRASEDSVSGMRLLTGYLAKLKEPSQYCTKIVHAHAFVPPAEIAANLGVTYRSQLEAFYALLPTHLSGYSPGSTPIGVVLPPRRVIPSAPGASLSEEAAHALRQSVAIFGNLDGVPSPLRFVAGSWPDHRVTLEGNNSVPTFVASAGDQRAARRFASAVWGTIRGFNTSYPISNGPPARFTNNVRNIITVNPLKSPYLMALTPSSNVAIEVSEDNGVTFSSSGFVANVVDGELLISKASGDWSAVPESHLHLRYGWGAPVLVATAPSGPTDFTLETGALVTTDNFAALSLDTGWPILPTFTPLVVQPPPAGTSGGTGNRNLAATGAGS